MTTKTPVVLSSDSKQHEPIGSSDTVPASVIPLSIDKGNLLEKRDDGLYYGLEAPADLSSLYVDSVNGDDSNAGTRAAPFKTLGKALTTAPATQNSTIHLRAGGEYVMRPVTVSGCTRLIDVYDDPYIDGDKKPSISTTVPWYYWYNVLGVNRPTIKAYLQYNNGNGYITEASIGTRLGAAVEIRGCIIDLHAANDRDLDPPEPPAGKDSWGVGDMSCFRVAPGCSLSLYGCYIKTSTTGCKIPLVRKSLNGDFGTVNLLRCIVENDGVLLSLGSGSTISDGPNYGNNPTAWTSLDPNNVSITANTTARLTDGKTVNGYVRDSNGVPRNVTANIVL